MKLPASLKKYFWDVHFKGLDTRKCQRYIADRILEYGDVKAAQWLFAHFQKEMLKNALQKSRAISPKSAYFWAAFFGIPRTKLLCSQKSFQKLQSSHWQS